MKKIIGIPFAIYKFVYLKIKFTYFRVVFYFAKRKADKMHKMTDKRYFVVPKAKGKIMVVNNSYIKRYNKGKTKNKRINIHDLLKMSYYYTE